MNRDTHSVINNRHHAQHNDVIHQVAVRAGSTGLGLTIEE